MAVKKSIVELPKTEGNIVNFPKPKRVRKAKATPAPETLKRPRKKIEVKTDCPKAARTAKVAKAVALDTAKKLKNAVKAVQRRKPAEEAPESINGKRLKTVVEFKTPRAFIVSLLLERKFTDNEIHAKVIEQFGEGKYTTNPAYVQLTRSDINGGYLKALTNSGKLTRYICQIVLDEGKRVEKPYVRSPNNKRPELFPDA